MNGYTKLFGTIVTSTVWELDSDVRVVWITMLAMCDQHGEVMASVPGLAKVAGVSREACERALATFMAPDPDSRTTDFEGRRIEKVDGGWLLLNHAKYRKQMSIEERRLRDAERKRTVRMSADSPHVSASVRTRPHASENVRDVSQAEAEAEADPKAEKSLESAPRPTDPKPGKPKRVQSRITSDWQPSPDTLAKLAGEGFTSAHKCLPSFVDYWVGNGKLKADWDATFRNWVRNESRDMGQREPAPIPRKPVDPDAGPPPADLARQIDALFRPKEEAAE